MKLCQVTAIVKGKKNQTERQLTDLYQTLQHPEPITGFSKTYTPKDEEGEKFQPESKRVQLTVADALRTARTVLTELFDIVATQDSGNCKAVADIKVDGKVILTQVPVTHMLFLEKKLVDIHTFISKLPVLDPADEWKYDTNKGYYVADPTVTSRTKKIPTVITKAQATDKHPAQTELLYEDRIVGTWTNVKFSGGIPADQKREMLDRVVQLQDAVKAARQEANGASVEMQSVGGPIFDFILGQGK